MSHLIKATVLAKNLGISRFTVKTWCQRDPKLALKKDGDWYIRLSELAKRQGLDSIRVHTLTKDKWIKAVDFAAKAHLPRRTLAYWCKTIPLFGLRVGRIWYVDPSQLGATESEIEAMRRWNGSTRGAQ